MTEQKAGSVQGPLMKTPWVLTTLLIVAFLSLWYFLKPVDPDSASIVESLIFVILSGASALVFLVLAYRFNFTHTKPGQTMSALVIGFLLWFLAETVWLVYMLMSIEPSPPSIADIFWIAGYVPQAIALLMNARAIRAKFSPTMMVIWVSISLTMAMVLLLEVIPFLVASPGIDTIITVVYPICDAIIIILALATALKFKAGEVAKPWAALIAGFVLTSVGDIWYTFAIWTGVYATAYNPVDFFLTLGYLAYVVSGLLFMRLYGKERVSG